MQDVTVGVGTRDGKWHSLGIQVTDDHEVIIFQGNEEL